MFLKYTQLFSFCKAKGTIQKILLKSRFSSTSVFNAQENIIRSKLEAAPSAKGLTVPELLRSHTGNWGNRTAFECAVSGLKFTHNEVHKYSKGFGAALLKLGLKRGDVVIILLPNCPQYAPVLHGMLDTGIVAAPMNPALTCLEIPKLAAQIKAKAVVTLPELMPLVMAIRADPECASIKHIISAGKPAEGMHNFFEMVRVDPSQAEFLDGSKIDTI